MVHLNEIMKEKEHYYLANENATKWLYCYIFNLEIQDGKFLNENKLSYQGYKNLPTNQSELDACINNNGKMNYTTSIPLFIGVHLADKEQKYNDKVLNFYKTLKDNKQKFVFSLCFTYLQEEFNKDIENMKEDKLIYQYLMGENLDETVCLPIDNDNIDIFDLILYKKVLYRDKILSLDKTSITENIIHMLNNFSNAIKRITTDRYNNKAGITIEQEYDVQDILFSFFKFYFNDAIRENPLKKKAGSNSIIDICFPERKIYIEIKMLKQKDNNEKNIIEQLKKDMFDYNQKEVENLIIFVYDPFKKIKDKDNFRDFEKSDNGYNYNCTVVIQD